MRQHRNFRIAALLTTFAGTAILGATLMGSTPASADTECMTVSFPGTRLIQWDGYNPEVRYSPNKPVTLAAGSYTLSASSHDDYAERVTVTQTSEIWELQFLDANQTVVATSGLTADLPDKVAVADWTGSIGEVTVPAGTVWVRAHHRPDAFDDGSANSVDPVSATICPKAVEPTSTTAPTTTEPPTSTTAAPTSTTAAPTTVAPTSSVAPSTVPVKAETTTPVSVLAETTIKGAVAPADQLAVTGTSSKPIGGIALVLLGVGILMLGYRAQSILRRDS